MKNVFLALVWAAVCAAQWQEAEQREMPATEQFTIMENILRLPSSSGAMEFWPQLKTKLSSEGNFTFFLPTNKAVKSFVQKLKWKGQPVTPRYLSAILAYHLLDSAKLSIDFKAGSNIVRSMMNDSQYVNLLGDSQTLNVVKSGCARLKVAFGAPSWAYTVSNVLYKDIKCSNGVIHIVNRVFSFPKFTTQTLADGSATSMQSAASSARLSSLLDSMSNITVFVPLNAAIDSLLSGGDVDPDSIRNVLMTHTARGALYSSHIGRDTKKITMLSGEEVDVVFENNHIEIGGSRVLLADVLTRNGVLHVVDGILTPKPGPRSGHSGPSLANA